MYIAGLDIHDILRRSPLSHNQGIESIMWLTTLAGVVRAARRAAKGRSVHHFHYGRTSAHLPATTDNTGVAAPAQGQNIGSARPVSTLLKVLSTAAHGAIIVTPAVYLAAVAFGRLEQPEWFAEAALPYPNLTQGYFASLRVTAAIANYTCLYFLKRVSKAADAAACRFALFVPSICLTDRFYFAGQG